MRYLFSLLIILPLCCFSQPKIPYGFEGFRTYDCIRFCIRQFAAKNDSVTCHLDSILKPNTKTIYVMKAPYMEYIPDTASGYNIKLVDVEKDAAMLYKEQCKNDAIILYLSDGLQKLTYSTVWCMPMVAVKKKFKKPTVEYDNSHGFKAVFFFNDATAKYTYDRTECYSATK